jgi:hypothetical protein
MAEIEIILPTVQYGNVKVKATPEELGLSSIGDSHALGVATAVYLNLFSQGFKVGASMDVVPGLQETSQGVSEAQAQRYLDEGLGGVTELPEDGPDGAGVDGDGAAPWDKPQVDGKPKPWESGSAAPADKPVVDSDW